MARGEGPVQGAIGAEPHRAAYRLDRNQQNDGWWALDDVIRVITGYDRIDAQAGWWVGKAVDLVKVMTAFRALGAESRLEICLPTAYQEIVDQHPTAVDNQIRKSVELSRQA